MAKFIDTTKMSEEELDRQIMEDLGLYKPRLPKHQEEFRFDIGKGPNAADKEGKTNKQVKDE